MIVQVETVEHEYEGECHPVPAEYKYWHRFVSTDGIKYHLVGPQPLRLKPQQLLNIKRYPKSWVRKYYEAWGLDWNSNYVKEIV